MGRIGLKIFLDSHDATVAFGRKMGKELPRGTILALSGPLGAGKTSFVQGLAQGLGITDQVQSPTFVLLNIYEGLCHFDLYRLKGAEEFIRLGFTEYLQMGALCAIEWPDRIAGILPLETVQIDFRYENNGRIAVVNS